MRRRLAFLSASLLIVVAGVASVAIALATGPDPEVSSVVTAADYESVTVTFTHSVTGTGTDDAVVLADISATDAGANLTGVAHAGTVLTFEFDGPVQPATAVLAFAGTNVELGATAEVPLAAADWALVESALRGIQLPFAAEVPVVAEFMAADPARTASELLPSVMSSSLDLPSTITISRNSPNFHVTFNGAIPLTTVQIGPTVELNGTAADPDAGYGISLGGEFAPEIDLSVGLGGAVVIDGGGSLISGSLSLELDATGTSTLSGSIGFVEAAVAATMLLDATFTFDPTTPETAPVVTLTEADVSLDSLLISGLSPVNIELPVAPSVDPLLAIEWPSMPISNPDGTRVESATVIDTGWAAADLRKITNIGITDLLFAPSGLATWLGIAQDGGVLDTDLPIVGGTLGETVGIAESLAMAQNQIAAALSVAGGTYGIGDPPIITAQNICTVLGPLRLRAAQLQEAIGLYGDSPTVEQVNGIVIDGPTTAAITDAFADICGQLFGSLTLDLAAGTIETDLSVPSASYDFLEGASPGIDLGFEAAGLGELSLGVDAGTWDGAATVNVGLTLGVKLDPAADLLATHGLVIDLDDTGVDPAFTAGVPADLDDTGIDQDDITAAHRIYIPAGDQIADSSVSITGTGIAGEAQIGFLDLSITGDVSLTPAVTLTPIDSALGLADGKVDMAELMYAAQLDISGNRDIESVLEIGIVGDDVDAHFLFTNDLVGLVGSSARVDIAGDLSALFVDPPTFEFRTTSIAGPEEVDADTLAIGQTFGDALDISEISAADVIAMVAGMLEMLAANSSEGAGDQRIPIIDVSLNEVSGFTIALADVADQVRNRVPATVSELEMIVNDALAANGMGQATVAFTTSGPSGDPELTLAVDAGVEAAASFPVSFDIADTGGPLHISPIDGGARLDAVVRVDFVPVLGIRLNDGIPFGDRIFVRDINARFDFLLNGAADGGVRFGPLEATLSGDVLIGDADLSTGGFTAELTRTSNGSGTIPLSAIPSDIGPPSISGSVPVAATINVEVPLLGVEGSVGVAGAVPGSVTFESPDLTVDIDVRALLRELIPDLGTLVEGAIEAARFMARGTEEVSDMGDSVPVVGGDVAAQFGDISNLLNDIADEIELAVEFLESDDADAAVYLETQLDALLVSCSVCDADVYWTGDGEDLDLFTASGIEILLTLGDSTSATTSTTASLGLEPIVEIDLDVSDATALIGYNASIGMGLSVEDGFYLFPGIDNGIADDDANTLVEIYASLHLDSTVVITLAGLSASADAEVDVVGPLNSGTAAGLKVDMPERLPFAAIVNRSRSMSETLIPSLNADITADLPIVLDLGEDSVGIGLTLPFVFEWSFADTLEPSFDDATFVIDEATLDVGSLTDVIADTLGEFDQYNPLSLADVRAALDTEVPLIDQTIRQTLVDLCNASGGGGTCVAFQFLSNTGELINELATYEGGVPLGSFQILPAPPEGTSRYTPPGISIFPLGSAPTSTASPSSSPPPGPATDLSDRVAVLTGGYMTLPILTDFPAIMGIVLGGELTDEVDIVRFEIPVDAPLTLGPSFNFKRELFDLNAGIIEGNLSVALNGGIGVHITGGFGYSTRGIQTGNAFDGIFLIDNEINEIAIGAYINASVNGKFSVAGDLASVTFKGSGGFSATAGVDLFDESPVLVGRGGGDGKLYFDEIAIIADAYLAPGGLPQEFSPLCMFQLNTTGKWHLSFSGKAKVLGITVFNESFSEGSTLWNETISCTLRTRIARVEDRQLILHGGPNADDRFDGEGDVAENFRVVRTGDSARVEWHGSGTKASLTFALSSFDTIIAEMGLHNDTVDVANNIPKPVLGRGGPGTDTLRGGGGNDDLDGGDAGDTIDGRGGNDSIRGSGGLDIIIGGAGNDDLDGGSGNDTYRFHNGFGTDELVDTSGIDTLDMTGVTVNLEGDAAFGDATIEGTDGSLLMYFSGDIDRLNTGSGNDVFVFKDREPNGFRFDGGVGSDDVIFMSGRRDRQISVSDSGGSGTDNVTVVGTSASDTFLLRAGSTSLGEVGTNGFVARLAGALVDRYDYDDSIENLEVDGGLSADTFALDDNATSTHIIGGQGEDFVQVGQVFGVADCEPNGSSEGACPIGSDIDSVRGSAVGVSDVADNFVTTVITRGHISNGITHPLVIDGDDGGDTIVVFSNKAEVTANGGDGNDNFVARAFILTASVELNGEGGIDDFTYVVNALLNIDGGAGVDTFTIVGTEADDGFLIDVDDLGRSSVLLCKIGVNGLPDADGVCAITSFVENVEVISALGIEGDDVFWIRGTVPSTVIQLNGGEHSDRFVIGDGTLDAITGPVVISGDDAGAVPPIADPLVLPGEDDTPAFAPAATGGTDRGDSMLVDASLATAALTGELTSSLVIDFGMASGPFNFGSGEDVFVVPNVLSFSDLEFATIELGSGEDDVLISSTHAGNSVCDADGCPLSLLTGGGDDDVDVHSIDGVTVIDLGFGDDTVTVGQPDTDGDLLDQIDAGLTVIGGAGTDNLDLDNMAASFTRLDVAPGLVTNASLAPAGISHNAIELVDIRLGDLSDVINVRGTAADATLGTHVHGNGGNERFYVSSQANLTLGTSTDHLGGDLDDVLGPLFVHGGGGALNLLMISDREASAGDPAVSYDGTLLSGLAPATINHDVTGAFGGGITIWSSESADVISVTGTDRSTVGSTRTLTSLNTGDGGDQVDVDLLDGVDGAFVLNTEEGDDTVNGGTSSLGIVVFGGLGGDNLTTGSGNDVVLGDLGTVESEDGNTIYGHGGPNDDTDGGTQPLDIVISDYSGGDDDTISSGAGNDVVFAGTGSDSVDAGAGDDVVLGGHGTRDPRRLSQMTRTLGEDMPGIDTGDASLAGGPDNDLIFGQQGNDTMFGGSGQDILIGGHSAAAGLDGADTIHGNAGEDLIVGDNAEVDDGPGTPPTLLHDVVTTVVAAPAGSGGGDTIFGGPGNDEIYGQQGDDTLNGEGGDDIIEGNSGADTISGGADQDDLMGGGSALDGVLDGTRSWTVAGVGLADENDTVSGDGGADVLLGDNGWIRRTEILGVPVRLGDLYGSSDPTYDNVVVRLTLVSEIIDPAGSYGSDLLKGGDGPDEMHGQLDTTRTTLGGNLIEGDEMYGGAGEDVLVGDLGYVVTILEDGSAEREITDAGPFLAAILRAAGTLTRQVTLFHQHDADHVDTGDASDAAQFGGEGDDLMHGGDGNDVIHGGSGDDVANGNAGFDVVFGGDGNDAIWGGSGNDELFGGHDEDALDVRPRNFTTTVKGVSIGPDSAVWFEAAPTAAALTDFDVAYGGWNTDELQADEKGNSPKTPADRLIDWNGDYNRYLSCDKGKGGASFIRLASPSLRAFLTDLAIGRGAIGISGARELGLVETPDGKLNTGSVGGGDHVECGP